MDPRVTVVTAAYNLAEFLPRAIDSVLNQLDPGGPVEIVVVDDGSEDGTQEVIASYGDRIRSKRQPNGGANSANALGVSMANGEYIAFLDADDEWPADRLERHVAALDAHPEFGLVHGDMEVIDVHGVVTAPSRFAAQREEAVSGRVLGPLLSYSRVSGGAATFRSSLRPAFMPLPREAAYHDWTIAACIAAVAEIGVVQGVANRYRFRGNNDSLGATAADQPRIQGRELDWRRWMLLNLVDDADLTAQDVDYAVQAFNLGLTLASQIAPGGARSLINVDPELVAAELSHLPGLGSRAVRTKALARAYAHDPLDAALLIDCRVAAAVESTAPRRPVADPLISFEARDVVLLAWLDEVVTNPSLLTTFAQEYSGTETSLAVMTPADADLAKLAALFDASPLLASPGCDVVVLAEPLTTPARNLLISRASGLVTLTRPEDQYAALELDASVEPLVATRTTRPRARLAATQRRASPSPGDAAQLTIVIPTLDATSTRVVNTIEQAHATTEVPHQIVVVDNGSPPQGFTGPVNAGIRSANTPYVVVMNDDVELLPGWWEPLRQTLDAGAAVVFPKTIDGRMRHDFAAWCFGMTQATIEAFSVAPGEFFDPAMVVWYQDTDLLERLLAAGSPPVQVDASEIRHGYSETVEGGDRGLRAWVQSQIAKDEIAFRSKHPQVGDVSTEWTDT
jgi:glycosyltransferase involved in cell wall biosynthesis